MKKSLIKLLTLHFLCRYAHFKRIYIKCLLECQKINVLAFRIDFWLFADDDTGLKLFLQLLPNESAELRRDRADFSEADFIFCCSKSFKTSFLSSPPTPG
jgi:hypothetical protein